MGQIQTQVWKQVYNKTRDLNWNPIHARITSQITIGVRNQIWNQIRYEDL